MSRLKKCTNCGDEKLTSAFYAQKNGRFGVRGACKACSSVYSKNRLSDPVIKSRHKNLVSEFIEKNPLYAKRWRERNKDRMRLLQKKWIAANRGRHNARAATYRAKKAAATVSWADLIEIGNIYDEGAYQGMEVDHIYPIVSDRVCGLHVEDNLQLLTVSENRSKGNSFVDFS